MGQKKVVSIEDRIPKLKQTRKKKANRRLILYLSIFFLSIFIVVYLQSPLSHVHLVNISGNRYVASKEIKKLSDISNEDNFWSVDLDNAKVKIEAIPQIKAVNISKKFPNTVAIHVTEYDRVGYVKQDGSYFPLLENGKRLESSPLNKMKGDAPLLADFKKQTYLQDLTEELQRLPKTIVNLISEIHWDPSKNNPYKIRVYMNDGYEVEASIRNFSKTMRAYPSIAAQLKGKSEGTIHIGDGGAVFDPYNKDDKQEEENQNEGEG